ncbi:MAG: PAC2 family protein, partial [Candidatus Omnitrophica bacterium]|nr:PAC2 family protein [Candidatus Omnitrophota bacterium]
PGMGNVSIRAAEFLCENLQPVEFAELSASGFFYPHDAWIVDGQVERPRLPSGKFYFWKNNQGRHDLIIFICESQPSVEKGYNYAKLVLDVAATFNVKRVFTFASMPSPIDHTQDSRVWGTATDKKILNELRKFDISVMLSGQISGLNGLLLSVARERGIEGICFLAEIPLYALQIENPKASKAVLGVFLKLLQVKMDFNALDERAKIIEDEIEKLVDYFKSGTGSDPISEEDIEVIKKTLASVTRLPESARLKIEELFKVAEKDITKANELKNELDRWQIYKEYEDRFLDLFKQKEKDNN